MYKLRKEASLEPNKCLIFKEYNLSAWRLFFVWKLNFKFEATGYKHISEMRSFVSVPATWDKFAQLSVSANWEHVGSWTVPPSMVYRIIQGGEGIFCSKPSLDDWQKFYWCRRHTRLPQHNLFIANLLKTSFSSFFFKYKIK